MAKRLVYINYDPMYYVSLPIPMRMPRGGSRLTVFDGDTVIEWLFEFNRDKWGVFWMRFHLVVLFLLVRAGVRCHQYAWMRMDSFLSFFGLRTHFSYTIYEGIEFQKNNLIFIYVLRRQRYLLLLFIWYL